MEQSGSYNVASFSASAEAEIRRLNAQVDLFWTGEYELLKRYGLRDGMEIMDCGCGPGRLIQLLKGQMPGLRITGLEMDPQLVKEAKSLIAEHSLSGCQIIQGTAEKPGLAEAAYDLIILRLVLEHVPDPIVALRSLGRLLKPEGRLVVIANDFEFHLRTWPPVPQLERLYEAYRASRRKDGGDPCIGRRLPRLMAQADLKVIGFEIEVAHNAVLGDTPFLKAEGAGIPAQLVHAGFLDGAILEEMTRTWRSMLLDADHCIMRPLFVGVGEKTKETAKENAGAKSYEKDSVGKKVAESKSSRLDPAKGPGEMLAVLQAIVTSVLKDQLKVLRKDLVDPEDLLMDLGLDSLAALDLQESIKSAIGVEVPLEKLLENVSVRDLAKALEGGADKREPKAKMLNVHRQQKETTPWEEGEI
jgi:ubiquinone/menaquinone biosynthesis C-methylase UbiE/acyl carrier protein